jgi:hypothetical protein
VSTGFDGFGELPAVPCYGPSTQLARRHYERRSRRQRSSHSFAAGIVVVLGWWHLHSHMVSGSVARHMTAVFGRMPRVVQGAACRAVERQRMAGLVQRSKVYTR